MKVLRNVGSWFAIVGIWLVLGCLIEARGHLPHWHSRYELEFALYWILSWGGLGAGVGTCAVAAWFILSEVWGRRLAWGWAVVGFAAVCLASVVLPVIVMSLPQILGWKDVHPFSKLAGLQFLGVCSWMLIAAVAAFGIFIPCVFTVIRVRPDQAGKQISMSAIAQYRLKVSLLCALLMAPVCFTFRAIGWPWNFPDLIITLLGGTVIFWLACWLKNRKGLQRGRVHRKTL